MKRPKLRIPVKAISVIFVVFLFISFIMWYIGRTVINSGYFKVKDIIYNNGNTIDLSYLKGKSIFSIDLDRESNYITQSCPSYRKVNLVRILPNRLSVKCLVRQPFAYIKLYRYFCIDEDLVLFDMPNQLEKLDLPVILGLETKIFGPRPGNRYNIKELVIALNLIKEIEKNRVFKEYKIKRINLGNLANASFFLLAPLTPDYSKGKLVSEIDGLEVKVGQEDIKNKISILAGLFTQEKKNIYNIKYIDLRFKEPVIKFKDK